MDPRSPISISNLDPRYSMPDESENRDDMTEGFLDTLQTNQSNPLHPIQTYPAAPLMKLSDLF